VRRAVFAALLVTGGVCAQTSSEYLHDPNRIYPVRAGVGITTVIDLGEGNHILDYATGFGSGWETSQRDHLLYLKPLDVDVDTNLAVRTGKGLYMFELRVVAADWKTLEQAKAAGVEYRVAVQVPPQPPARAATATASREAPSVTIQPGRAYHFAYAARTNARSRWLQPAQVYDDGRFTYVHVSTDAGMPGGFPSVLAREQERGDDVVVNSSVQDRVIIVHGVHPYLVLRHGRGAALIRRLPAEEGA